MSLGRAGQADQRPIPEELKNWKNLLAKCVGCYTTEHPKNLHRDLVILSSGWDLRV